MIDHLAPAEILDGPEAVIAAIRAARVHATRAERLLLEVPPMEVAGKHDEAVETLRAARDRLRESCHIVETIVGTREREVT